MSKGLTRILKPAGAMIAVATLFGGAAVLTQSSEAMLRSSFARALAPQAQVVAQRTSRDGGIPISGSEEFWLSAMGHDPLVTKAVSLGDAITFTLEGQVRNYRVTSVSEIAPRETKIDTKSRSDRLLLVTAGDPADPLARPIRFVIELETRGQDIAAKGPQQTL